MSEEIYKAARQARMIEKGLFGFGAKRAATRTANVRRLRGARDLDESRTARELNSPQDYTGRIPARGLGPARAGVNGFDDAKAASLRAGMKRKYGK